MIFKSTEINVIFIFWLSGRKGYIALNVPGKISIFFIMIVIMVIITVVSVFIYVVYSKFFHYRSLACKFLVTVWVKRKEKKDKYRKLAWKWA